VTCVERVVGGRASEADGACAERAEGRKGQVVAGASGGERGPLPAEGREQMEGWG
jgi:hypothetical protein